MFWRPFWGAGSGRDGGGGEVPGQVTKDEPPRRKRKVGRDRCAVIERYATEQPFKIRSRTGRMDSALATKERKVHTAGGRDITLAQVWFF